jgi:hypothetical protein
MYLRIAFVLTVLISAPVNSLAQSRSGAAKSPLCTRENALEIIKQQVEVAKNFNHTIRRITVLIRAADLLWPYQQDKARTVFNEAFDLAIESEKDNQQKGSRSIILRMQTPDQRYVVIRAVAKRDPAWAKELTRQMLKSVDAGEASAKRNSFEDSLNGNRLLDSAYQLLATDLNAALDLARAGLNYPASFLLTRFLYRLAEINQPAADQFYAHALAAYDDRPLREFLYLQAYPFAWTETRNTPVAAFHEVPASFVTSQSLQRQFVQVLLRRAQQALDAPLDESDTYRSANEALRPGTVHLLEGLIKLEPQVRTSLPDLLPALTQAREKILVSLSPETQKSLLQPGREISSTPDQTFDEQVESALKVSDVDERDGLLANAVLSRASQRDSLADVVHAIDQISESTLRAALLEWLYFQRAVTAIKDKQFNEAETLTAKVEGLEQRAFLHLEIDKAIMSRSETQTHTQEMLDEAISEAKKAGMTIFAARVLLTASSLYLKIDPSRSIAVLADAVNCINRIESPDFFSDDQAMEKTPTRKGRGGRYAGEYLLGFYMPGLDPERAFREVAKIDFDTALSQSSGLTDKFQRAMSTLGLVHVCLNIRTEKPRSRKIAF